MPDCPAADLSNVDFKPLVGVAVGEGVVLPMAPSLANAAHVRKETVVAAPPGFVWDALRDFGALHTRLVRGFVVETRREGSVRTVAFANGAVVREVLIECDDDAMKLVYAVAGHDHLIAHSASAQVFAGPDGGSKFVWMADFLPRDMEPYISEQMGVGIAAIKQTLEEDAARKT